MGIRIIFSESGQDLVETTLGEVLQFQKTNPYDRAILIVPETSKMDMEHQLLAGSDAQGIMMTEVLSFSRFCYRILGEVGRIPENTLDDVGKTMLLYKILKEQEKNLIHFRNLCQKPGFITEIIAVMDGLKRVLIGAEEMKKASTEMKDPVLSLKAQDLGVLFREYDLQLQQTGLVDPQQNYTDTAMQLDALSRMQAEAVLPWPQNRLDWIFHTRIWILGFGETRDFTLQEYSLINAMSRCCSLTVTLVCDRPGSGEGPFGGNPLFRAGRQSLLNFIDRGLCSEAPHYIGRKSVTVFSRLAECWGSQNPEVLSLTEDEKKHAVTLIHTSSKREEAAILAGEILRLVREERFRYRDITVLASEIEGYSAILHAVFKEASIPYFIDEKKSLAKTSLARMLRGLLDLQLQNWSRSSLMNYVRCGLCDASPEEIDRFETFLLSSGMKWRQQIFDDSRYSSEEGMAVFEIRNRLCRNAMDFETGVRNSRVTHEYCLALRNFIQSEELFAKIQKMSGVLSQQEEGDAGIALVKAWNELLHLLEQMEQIAREAPLDTQAFKGILMSGMEKAFSGIIPSSVDQVHFSSVKQAGDRRTPVLFLIGMTDTAYPAKISSEGILKDSDREAFSEFFKVSIPSIVSDKYYEDLFLTYDLFSFPQRRLYLSCPQPEEQESELFPFVRACIPDCAEITREAMPGPFDRQIYSKTAAFHTMLSLLPLTNGNRDLAAVPGQVTQEPVVSDENGDHLEEWNAFYAAIAGDREFLPRLNALQKISRDPGSDICLSKGKIADRYRFPVTMSISQLETYNACAYSHFAGYLLKLKPRETGEAEATDTGSLMHGILEKGVQEFIQKYNALDDLEGKRALLEEYRSKDFDRYSMEWMQKLVAEENLRLFTTRGTAASKGRSSCRLAASTLKALFMQISPDGFIPEKLEWEFSGQNQNSLTIPLPGLPPVYLRGKIDRVDRNGSFFRVIDYKSGNKEVELDKWYHGLSLQLPAYIAAYMAQYPDLIPQDAAYMRFDRPVFSYNNGSAGDILENHEKNIAKQFQLKGTKLDQESLVRASLFTIKQIQKLSTSLLSGSYSIRPKKLKGCNPPCNYCTYQALCGFEPRYHEYEFLEPIPAELDENGKKMKKQDAFCRKIEKELGKEGQRG